MGRDETFPDFHSRNTDFNSHARVGRDPEDKKEEKVDENFNSHARVGRDVVTDLNVSATDAISTHTPAWGVTLYIMGCTLGQKFQLTRPRGA